jgi:predicted nucleotide-binding protein (sugar kinase/HSP70/actin superfamily)
MLSILPQGRRAFCKLSPYEIVKGMIVFHDGPIPPCLTGFIVLGRYVEILRAAPSTNKKLKSMYKIEALDLFTNRMTKEYLTYGQIEKFDSMLTSFISDSSST